MRLLPLLAATAAFAADPAAHLRSGRQAARMGDWTKAESRLLHAEEGARLLDDASLLIAARAARIDLRLTAEETDSAAALLIPLPSRPVARADSAVWHLSNARIALARGDDATASSESDNAVRTATRAKEAPLLCAAHIVRSRVLLARGDRDGAVASWKKARGRTGRIGVLEASVAAQESRIALAKGDLGTASKAAERSLQFWRASQDVGGLLATLPLRAEIDQAAGSTPSALESWTSQVGIAESTGLPRLALRAHLKVAQLDPTSAQLHQDRAREILRTSGLAARSLSPELQGQLR